MGFVKRRVPLVEQELPTHPEHLCSPSIFSGVRVPCSLVFCVVSCRSLFVLLSFFHLSIVLSVLFLFTDSDYSFGIFKLFLHVISFIYLLWLVCKLPKLFTPWWKSLSHTKTILLIVCILITRYHMKGLVLGLWCWMPFSIVVEFYRDGQFFWLRKPEYPIDNITDLLQTTDKVYHIILYGVHLAMVRTHNFSGDRH
jgi:hypothetical protein